MGGRGACTWVHGGHVMVTARGALNRKIIFLMCLVQFVVLFPGYCACSQHRNVMLVLSLKPDIFGTEWEHMSDIAVVKLPICFISFKNGRPPTPSNSIPPSSPLRLRHQPPHRLLIRLRLPINRYLIDMFLPKRHLLAVLQPNPI